MPLDWVAAGIIETESREKCFPTWLCGSPPPRPLEISTISSKRLARRFGSTPAAAHSPRCSSLKAPPTPAPMTKRPLEIKSTVAIVCAIKTGWRSAGNSTAVPSLTRLVRAASAPKVASGSSLGLATKLSPTQTESKPASSTRVAILKTRSALSGC